MSPPPLRRSDIEQYVPRRLADALVPSVPAPILPHGRNYTARVQGFYPWIVFVHVLAAFAFVLAHGVSMFVADRVRRERTHERVAAMLDLSAYTLPVMYGSLVVLVLAGILAGMVGGHFARLWIWLAIAILVVEIAAMYALAASYYGRLREAIGQARPARRGQPAPSTPVPVSSEELGSLLASRRVDEISLVGTLGLVVIIWLMVVKPF
jgi:hypothetical protein